MVFIANLLAVASVFTGLVAPTMAYFIINPSTEQVWDDLHGNEVASLGTPIGIRPFNASNSNQFGWTASGSIDAAAFSRSRANGGLRRQFAAQVNGLPGQEVKADLYGSQFVVKKADSKDPTLYSFVFKNYIPPGSRALALGVNKTSDGYQLTLQPEDPNNVLQHWRIGADPLSGASADAALHSLPAAAVPISAVLGASKNAKL